ncbi:MAG: VWA containing CoxE family protein, partial [Myxococcota bacterium]
LCEQLFSAAHQATHFKTFKHYFFHNCPYETLYSDIYQRRGEQTARVLRDMDRTWFCVIVGDAAMAPYELTAEGGAIDYFHHNTEPGLVWLGRLADRFPRRVWLNPDPPQWWTAWTTQKIRGLFDMHPLTLDGLERAVADLRRKRV